MQGRCGKGSSHSWLCAGAQSQGFGKHQYIEFAIASAESSSFPFRNALWKSKTSTSQSFRAAMARMVRGDESRATRACLVVVDALDL